MATDETRIQLCGRVTVRLRGHRVEEGLPGRQGRLLFAYLAAHRMRPSARSELMDAIWPANPPPAGDAALSALLTKLRRVLGAEAVQGKHELRLLLPAGAWLDLEAATEGLHRAEAAVAQAEWARAWGPARVALHVAQRGFLPGYSAPWIDEIRARLGDMLERAHECVAAIGIGLGSTELPSAERSARALIKIAPYRESGYRLLMEVLAARGNTAEALLTYERLVRLLREELGASPSSMTQAVHRRLLRSSAQAADPRTREVHTVLFTDIVSSTERLVEMGDHAWRDLLARHHAVVRDQLCRFQGAEVDTAGDGFLATLPSPAAGIGCAAAILRDFDRLGIAVRAGIHTGECEVVDGKVSGITVHTGARIAAIAGAGQVLVSSTVKELVAGSDVVFEEQGTHVLKGLPGEWRLFSVPIG